MVVRGSACRAAIWTSRRSTPASKRRGHEGVPEHVRVHPGHSDSRGVGEVEQSAGCGVAVHPASRAVEQDRPGPPVADGSLDSARDRGWQRDQHDAAALADHPQHVVSVFLAEIGDVRTARVEDPQAEQAKEAHQRKVASVRGLAGGDQHGLELQVRQPQRRRLRATGNRCIGPQAGRVG